MCFTDFDAPSVYRESWHIARKEHKCSECRGLIAAKERYFQCFGVWDGNAERFKLCAFCQWLRERIAAAERAEGCRESEAWPPFGGLYEFMGDGCAEQIGLVSLDVVRAPS